MDEIRIHRSNPLYKQDLKNALDVVGLHLLKNKSILITGATGLIGSFLIDSLMLYNKMGGGVSIYAVGRNRNKANIVLGDYMSDPCFSFIEQDVRTPLPDSLAVDYIIPLASNTHPLAYSLYPIETALINVKGAEHALNLAAKCSATVLYPSSVEVYGNARGNDVFSEDYTGSLNLSSSRSCYTESKRLCEALCQSFVSEKNAKVKIIRLSRVFGPTMLLEDSKASSQFIKRALVKESIVLKSKGDQYYSYTYVADAVNALLFVLINGQNGVAYNVSTDKCNVFLKDFAEICASFSGTEVVYDFPSETEAKGFSIATKAIMDNSRLLELGWKPRYCIDDAISRTLSILSSN